MIQSEALKRPAGTVPAATLCCRCRVPLMPHSSTPILPVPRCIPYLRQTLSTHGRSYACHCPSILSTSPPHAQSYPHRLVHGCITAALHYQSGPYPQSLAEAILMTCHPIAARTAHSADQSTSMALAAYPPVCFATQFGRKITAVPVR